ncbi:MAG: AAA family ATPase [Euryarchaeota archaeon]|nr:AAA family ATPase [Euryarchaeota archaeon]
MPATGKSTLSRNLAKKIGAHVLRTDVIRKELIKRPTYTPEEKELVYSATFITARYLLRAGEKVIIDGTFYKRKLRQRVYRIAKETGAKLVVIECVVPDYIIKRRMERRKKRRRGPSQADYEVYRKMKEEFEPIRRRHITVDTSRHIKDNLRDVLGQIWL